MYKYFFYIPTYIENSLCVAVKETNSSQGFLRCPDNVVTESANAFQTR